MAIPDVYLPMLYLNSLSLVTLHYSHLKFTPGQATTLQIVIPLYRPLLSTC